MRTLVLNVCIFALAAILLFIFIFRSPSTIVIGNIDVSDFGLTPFISSEDLHSRITRAFLAAYRLGGDAMPREVVANSIEDEANQIDFEIPDIGISFSKLINYLPKKLGFDRNATVTGKLSPTEQGDYSFHAELTDHKDTVSFDGANPNLDALLLTAASELLRKRNPYVYASGLSVQERQICYADNRNCDFAKATPAYQAIYDGSNSGHGRHYRRWALLAISKIREDQNDYPGEIEFAKLAIVEWPDFSWGYYNWGVALAELGCYDGAIRAFSQTIFLDQRYAAAYNARGRIHLIRAEALQESSNDGSKSERSKALRDFQRAVSLNSDYPEAQINIGKAHRLDPTEERLARLRFDQVIETPNSSHAARAYQQLANLDLMQGDDAKYLDDMDSARRAMADNAVCGFAFSNSLREASGCMEQAADKRRLDLSSAIECKRHSEGLPVAENDDF
ncbi:hypothetical protein BH160DRAFT_2251 [Burkholderia sp. H160]|nr:hypothetical protein BH160DRAFT_2251 [Burkholderia sp. H160]